MTENQDTTPQAWRSIETAPQDGTQFIAYQDGDIYACRWKPLDDDGDGYCGLHGWLDEANGTIEDPTHWVPMPKAPE